MTAVTSGAPFPRARSGKRSDRPLQWGSPAVYFVALLLIALMLAPVVYIILGGFRTNSQITIDPAGLPNPWEFSNYLDVLTTATFWRRSPTRRSSRPRPRSASSRSASWRATCSPATTSGQGAMYALFAAGLMFPMTVAITPLYILVKDLGLINNLLGVILPQIAFALPTTIIILVPFLRAIPNEIEEAASIDGCSRLGFFWRMVLPLSLPGVITVGILAFIGSWNSYLLPLFILNDAGELHAAARRAGVLVAVLGGHGEGARVHLAVDDPRAGVLRLFERRIVGGLTGAVKG